MTRIFGESSSIADLERKLIKNPPAREVVQPLRRQLVGMAEEFNSGPKRALDPELRLSSEAFRTAIAFRIFRTQRPWSSKSFMSFTNDAWNVWCDAQEGERIVLSQGFDHLLVRGSTPDSKVLQADLWHVNCPVTEGRYKAWRPYPSGHSPQPLLYQYASGFEDSGSYVQHLVYRRGPDIPENIGFFIPRDVSGEGGVQGDLR